MNKIEWSDEEINTYNTLLKYIESEGDNNHAYWLDKLERLAKIVNNKHQGMLIGDDGE